MLKAALWLAALPLLASASGLQSVASSSAHPIASVGIIIDDLGNSLRYGRRAINLPGAVACAILPHTYFSVRLAEMARAHNKEVILHLPMASTDGEEPGPGNLDSNMPALEVAMTLAYDLQTVPHAVGISNHMGSLLTQQREPMQLLMKAIANRGDLFFVDSLTTADSVAGHAARQLGVPHLVRNIFLDNVREVEAIDRQFDKLVAIARERNRVLAIGHPYPETLEVLERRLPDLANNGIELVSLSKLLELQSQATIQ
ncbi:MAG: divergent polysaccharide deacetylase family protein [Gammaproteobacteria bacterium]|nr:divergent polysaccharide deacetylase family protein [Gammaproteobacteria bacterium]